MLFNFHLRPVEVIEPWEAEGRAYLHWFGLTDGWYWIDVGGDQLFSRTESARCHFESTKESGIPEQFVNYYVCRLWEDLLDQLPYFLEPVPEYVLERIKPGISAVRWRDQVGDYLFPETDGDWPTENFVRFDQVVNWLDQRRLPCGNLQHGPNIWFWNDGQTVFLHWDNREICIDRMQVWTASIGTLSMPFGTFVDEVRSFDCRFISAMRERILGIQRLWPRTDAHIDIPSLLREQEDRATWIDRAFEQSRCLPPTPWDQIAEMYDQLLRV